MLIIAQCNALHRAMPFLFGRIDNEAELLLPDNLLHSSSPVRKMVTEIDEDLWNDVEIIGWIYQFYISEKKNEVIGKVVKSEDIPAATQLFTPNWIVKYMVQNTLGRMWMATYPESSLKEKMEYYIEPAEQEPEVQKKIDATTPKELNPEELSFLDPACGSGHILVEAYDIFKEIYLERGYRTRDIPGLILGKNLYGLDIDDRAAQLAGFAVLMRARNDDRRLFNRDDLNLDIVSIVETKGIDNDRLLDAISKREGENPVSKSIQELVDLFEHAKTFGSLIMIPEELAEKLDDIQYMIESGETDSDDLFGFIAEEELESLKPVVNQAKFLAKKYDCVVANPPYMGSKGMNSMLKAFAKAHFPASKSDLFAIFIERNLELAVKQGLVGMITMQSWMFLSSYKKLREKIFNQKAILSMAHLGARGFDSIGGEVVSTTAFVLENASRPKLKGSYFRLIDGKSEMKKKVAVREAIQNPDCGWFFNASAADFKKIPGSPIAYWVSNRLGDVFQKNKSVSDYFPVKPGIRTGKDEWFLKLWFEVSINHTQFKLTDALQMHLENRWFPLHKGGNFRKWYGNCEHIIDLYQEGVEIKTKSPDFRLREQCWYFQPFVSWSRISSANIAFRYFDRGVLFSDAGPGIFAKEQCINVMGLLNSKLGNYFLKIINPTLNYQKQDIEAVPYIPINQHLNIQIAVDIEKSDWDFHETSWDFTYLPLLQSDHHTTDLNTTYNTLRSHWQKTTLEMQHLEQENNSVFIEAYGLQDELTPDVSFPEITLTCNPHYRYGNNKTEEEYEALLLTDTIKELISYAIACMMGRYSLGEPGLIYAHSCNEGFDPSKYKTFPADDDGILPIMDMEWFEDDAARRFVDFIKIAWPPETLDENLKFIADTLKPKPSESPAATIRRYLSTTFFKDHMRTYKKRPIYWLFSSGKQKAFECLVYLHRYNDSTLSRIRSNYLTPLQGNISARVEYLDHERDSSITASSQKKIQKQIDILKKKQIELKAFDDELRHFADMKICLDLDDGVKVNYGKFGNLLVEKKAITGKK